MRALLVLIILTLCTGGIAATSDLCTGEPCREASPGSDDNASVFHSCVCCMAQAKHTAVALPSPDLHGKSLRFHVAADHYHERFIAPLIEPPAA